MAMAPIVNGAPLVFWSRMAWAALVVPTCWLPKARDEGVRVTGGVVPVPDSATLCGLPGASSFTSNLPVWGPVVVGAKVTQIVQPPDGWTAMGVPHVLVTL